MPLPAIPPALLSAPAVPGTPAGPGVLAEFADGPGQTPGKRDTRIEPGLEATEPPVGFGPQWRATWTTVLKPAHDGYHRFSLAAAGKSSLYLDGALVAEGLREAIRFIDGPSYAPQAVIPLITGQPVTIRVKYETGPAIALVLQVWYPGEQLGTALARVPFGDDDPGAGCPSPSPPTPATDRSKPPSSTRGSAAWRRTPKISWSDTGSSQ